MADVEVAIEPKPITTESVAAPTVFASRPITVALFVLAAAF